MEHYFMYVSSLQIYALSRNGLVLYVTIRKWGNPYLNLFSFVWFSYI